MLEENLEFIDLSHTLSPEIPSWNLSCGYQQAISLDYDECSTPVKFRTFQINTPAGIGTHMDAPAHCIANALTIDQIPLQQLVRPCVMIDVSKKTHEKYSASAEDIIDFEKTYGQIPENSFVIIHTGWDKYWETPARYRNNLKFPCIGADAAELLLQRSVVGLGIDTLSPDRAGEGFPVHQLFLGAGKYIIENITNAENLPPTGAYIIALPLKLQHGTESPIRLIGVKKP